MEQTLFTKGSWIISNHEYERKSQRKQTWKELLTANYSCVENTAEIAISLETKLNFQLTWFVFFKV